MKLTLAASAASHVCDVFRPKLTSALDKLHRLPGRSLDLSQDAGNARVASIAVDAYFVVMTGLHVVFRVDNVNVAVVFAFDNTSYLYFDIF